MCAGLRAAARRIGLPGALAYRWQCRLHLAGRPGEFAIRAGGARFPLRGRRGGSDLSVFRQMYIDDGYRFLDDVIEPRLILDLGANVGYASTRFLTRFPEARLIAVEPDPDNFRVLASNLAPYGDRARAVMGAVWSRPASLVAGTTPYRDGLDWSRQVEERAAGPGEAMMVAYTIGQLLEMAGTARISILKIDIEGAETMLFRDRNEWLDSVDNLAVELHEDTQFGSAQEALDHAIEGRPFDSFVRGECTFLRRSIV
jgi:FkbM family methyltransferase